MHKSNDTFKRLRAVMKDVNGDHRQIIKTMQDQIDYLMEFIEIQGEILEEKTGRRQPELSEDQKKRLAHRGKKLNAFLLGQIEHTFALVHFEFERNFCTLQWEALSLFPFFLIKSGYFAPFSPFRKISVCKSLMIKHLRFAQKQRAS